MASHFEQLKTVISDLPSRPILDLGAGRGEFVIDALEHGAQNIVGLEKSAQYVGRAQALFQKHGKSVEFREGVGESMSFSDATFGFVNMAEVIEHVENPKKVLEETFRVLQKGGLVYMSVPSRLSINDTHYHLYFINWMPRFCSEIILNILGRQKNSGTHAGFQKLKDMHYYTFRGIEILCNETGFTVADMRIVKIKKRYSNVVVCSLALIVYRLLRPWYFKTFHLLLTK